MNVDREQQREILQLLFDAYPWTTNDIAKKISDMVNANASRAVGNLLYLQMHGLISKCVEVTGVGYERVSFDGEEYPLYRYDRCPKLTEKGIDFLLGDDGLSAILNTKTVRIEESSIKLLATALIENAPVSEEEKKSALNGLKQIPATVLQKWLTGLAEKAMPSHEATLELIRKAGSYVADAAGSLPLL